MEIRLLTLDFPGKSLTHTQFSWINVSFHTYPRLYLREGVDHFRLFFIEFSLEDRDHKVPKGKKLYTVE